MENFVRNFVLVVILLFLVTFGVENSHVVRVEYYFDSLTFNIPLYLLIFLTVCIGVIIGMLVGFRKRLSQRKTLKNLERENRDLKGKLPEDETSA